MNAQLRMVGLIIPWILGGCGDVEGISSEDRSSGALDQVGGVSLRMAFSAEEIYEGSTVMYEYETLAATDCTAAETLHPNSTHGIHLKQMHFLDQTSGRNSRYIGPAAAALQWSATNAEAEPDESTWSWLGVLTIREWSIDLVELGMTEGMRCGYSFEELDDCEPISDGVLRIVGERDYLDDRPSNLPPQYEDVETGALLCAASDAAS